MSYQPEERYWTDYLRIALPVVGLLLMLGLFWYWASAVIGDDDNDNPANNPTQVVALVTQPAPTATNTPEVNLTPETVTPEPTESNGASGGNDEPTNTPNAEEETPEIPGKGFKVGETVVTNSDDVNMRDDKTIDGNVVISMKEGTELEVTEVGVEVGDYVWVGVRSVDGEGYVADQFLDPIE